MAAIGPDIKIDVARILTIVVGIGVVGGAGYLAYHFANKAKENNVYNAASSGGYFSAEGQATRLKNALSMDYIFDWNVDEEEVLDVMQSIKSKKEFADIAKAYRKLTGGNQLLDDLRRVGSSDYLLVENILKKIN